MPVDICQHAVLVRPPLGKTAEIREDPLRVGMKDMRTIPMHEEAILVVIVKRIASDMIPPVNNENALAAIVCDPLCQYAPCKPSPDDQPIKHCRLRRLWAHRPPDAETVPASGAAS